MKKGKWRAIGLMSGTSLDGLDVVCVDFSFDHVWDFEILHAEEFPFTPDMEQQLRSAYQASARELVQTDVTYGRYMAQRVNEFIETHQLSRGSIDLVAAHGQTIFHDPAAGYTTQIGSGYHLAVETGLPVVCDFRSQDVALGGQGAPLVPIGDRHLFAAYDACVNIGGFANISFEQDGQRLAYDICAVNIVLNELCHSLGKAFDRDGAIAASAQVDHKLLQQLNSLPYFCELPPKSLGFEWVEHEIKPLLQASGLGTEDLIATFTEHAALQMGEVLDRQGLKKVLFTGGGVHNSHLMKRCAAQCQAQLLVPDKQIIDFKEALIFAFLGVLRHLGQPNILASVTGAAHDHSAGQVIRVTDC